MRLLVRLLAVVAGAAMGALGGVGILAVAALLSTPTLLDAVAVIAFSALAGVVLQGLAVVLHPPRPAERDELDAPATRRDLARVELDAARVRHHLGLPVVDEDLGAGKQAATEQARCKKCGPVVMCAACREERRAAKQQSSRRLTVTVRPPARDERDTNVVFSVLFALRGQGGAGFLEVERRAQDAGVIRERVLPILQDLAQRGWCRLTNPGEVYGRVVLAPGARVLFARHLAGELDEFPDKVPADV